MKCSFDMKCSLNMIPGDGGGDDDKISASEEAAARVIPFGLFSIICSSDIQHDIIPDIHSQYPSSKRISSNIQTLSSISRNISSNIQHDFQITEIGPVSQ